MEFGLKNHPPIYIFLIVESGRTEKRPRNVSGLNKVHVSVCKVL